MNRLHFSLAAATVAALLACGTPTKADRAVDQSGTVPAATAPTKAVPKPAPVKPTKPISAEQLNATESARDYLASQGFSRRGLIEQLTSDYGDGYEAKAATAAVDSLHVDWNAQAARSAKSYLASQSFSRRGLIEQLESNSGEGFTHDQAVYGVKAAGL
jgi:hypothetical protein